MKDIIYISEDKSLTIRLQFIVKNQLKYTHLGKSYPKHTQCLMYSNGLLKCFKTIVKHYKDTDDQLFAYKLVAEKCISTIDNKWLRNQIRLKLDKILQSCAQKKLNFTNNPK